MSIIYFCIYSCHSTWNSDNRIKRQGFRCMHDSNIYIKGKPIITVSGSLCGINAGIIGFILMEEDDIQLRIALVIARS